MKKTLHKHNIATLLIHFFTLTTVLFVMIIVLAGTHRRMMLNILYRQNEELVRHTTVTAQRVRSMLRTSTYQAFYNPYVTMLRRQKDISAADAASAMSILNTFVASNDFIDSIYVYNAEKACVYSTTAEEELLLPIFQDTAAAELFTNGTAVEPYLLYRGAVYSFIIPEKTETPAVSDNMMMVNFNATAFNGLYCQSFDSCEFLYRLETNEVIFSEAHSGDDGIRSVIAHINENQEHTGYVISTKPQNRMIWVYSWFDDMKLYYVRGYYWDEFFSELRTFRIMAFFITFITIFAMTIISLVMIIRVYTPLNKVVNHLVHSARRPYKENDKNFNAWIQEESALQKQYTSTVKNEFLKHLLFAALPDNHSLRNSFSEYNVALDTEKPLYLILAEEPFLPCTTGEKLIFEVIDFNENIIYIVQLADGDESYLNACLSEYSGTFLACSKQITDWRGIQHAFNRLQELHAFSIFYPKQRLFFERFLDEHKKETWYPYELQGKLFKAVKTGNKAEAKRLYTTIVQALMEYRYTTIIFGLKKLYMALCAVYCPLVVLDGKNCITYSIDYITAVIEQAESVSEIDAPYYELIEKICVLNKDSRIVKQHAIIEQVKYIVETRYMDMNLSLKNIAGELNFSSGYIAKVFKQGEKKSIADYINYIRLKHAVRLLLKTDLPVKDIAEQVGFINTQYFFVLFKKFAGTTPNEFRKRSEIAPLSALSAHA